MSGIHALSGAYAVDALDDDERTGFERHLATCAECRAEVQSFCETAALISESESVAPPVSMRSRVLADIGSVRPFPPEATAAPEQLATVTTLRRRSFPALVAAAVTVILLATGAMWHPWNNAEKQSLADQIRNAPDAVSVIEPIAAPLPASAPISSARCSGTCCRRTAGGCRRCPRSSSPWTRPAPARSGRSGPPCSPARRTR